MEFSYDEALIEGDIGFLEWRARQLTALASVTAPTPTSSVTEPSRH